MAACANVCSLYRRPVGVRKTKAPPPLVWFEHQYDSGGEYTPHGLPTHSDMRCKHTHRKRGVKRGARRVQQKKKKRGVCDR